ncbi:hypothetical protein BDB13_5350 [Rhodococcus sp. OK302]|nr:hypothetical protein BDB13_5350 [Rhodococcus sp. OK302]
MSRWQDPLPVAVVYVLRNAYGQNMSGLVPSTSLHILEDGWWMALTGAPDPSCNLALMHDGDVPEVPADVVEGSGASG